MQTTLARTTIYLEPSLRKALRLKSVDTSRSMSDLVNEALRAEFAEDAADLAAIEARKNEPTLSFKEFLKELKRNGTI